MLERIPPRERRDLIIAWLAISTAFAVIFLDLSSSLREVLVIFVISFLTAGIAFVLHEMAHKFTAMRFGFWAEFRMDPQMLLVALVLAVLVRFVFAAPGATLIYGNYISREQDGRISLAGPAVNLLLCIPFALLFLADSGGIAGLAGLVGLRVNAMIAFFNLIPVGVLDGRKVLHWNRGIFAASFLIALLVLVSTVILF